MIIETKYDLGQEVTIKAINWPATVVGIEVVAGGNLLYIAVYWSELEQRFAKMTEEDICAKTKG